VPDRIFNVTRNLKTLAREAEALADEPMLAFTEYN